MLLVAENIGKTFPGAAEPVLHGASFAVAPGEKVGIVGRSGCGKSTLARIVAGLDSADEGTVSFNGVTRCFGSGSPSAECGGREGRPGRESLSVREAWLSLQMVFQNPEASFSTHMSLGAAIWEGMAYHPGASRVSRAERRALVAEALEAVGLPASFAAKRAFEVSGGQCQRAAIARALISKPKLVICDEATSALDVTVQAKIMDLLAKLHAEQGMAVLFISHNVPLVANFCDRVYALEDGAMR